VNADGVPSILGTLARYQVTATFFLTGNFVRDYPAASKAIAAAGQRIGDHGGVHNYGTPWYGSDVGRYPAGVSAVGLAADPKTGGYWILKSDGGVDNFNAPWYGSMRGQVPAGQAMTGIAAE
jgi:hypothetical protein